jgi:omega-6 fatty acid desaturase (delta-12 desaturase)
MNRIEYDKYYHNNNSILLLVVHHIDSTIPHYRAKAATEVIKKKFSGFYLYESTPIFKAMWRIATKCFEVEKRKTKDTNEDLFVFVDEK